MLDKNLSQDSCWTGWLVELWRNLLGTCRAGCVSNKKDTASQEVCVLGEGLYSAQCVLQSVCFLIFFFLLFFMYWRLSDWFSGPQVDARRENYVHWWRVTFPVVKCQDRQEAEGCWLERVHEVGRFGKAGQQVSWIEWDTGMKTCSIDDRGEENLSRSLRLGETLAGLESNLLLTAGPALRWDQIVLGLILSCLENLQVWRQRGLSGPHSGAFLSSVGK